MQKVINVLAIASFGVSAVVVASGSWVYMNRYKLVNDVKNIAADEIAEMVPSMLSGALNPTAAGAVGGK